MTKSPPAHVSWGIAPSPAGKLIIGLTEKGEICLLSFLQDKAADIVSEWQSQWPRTKFASGADVKNFTRKNILLVGTEFQHAVWRVMSKIPSGSVTTYGNIALYIGNPRASRAVGAACGANPVPYLIPCHRVIAANGGLGGFSSGLGVKEKLLKIEGYL